MKLRYFLPLFIAFSLPLSSQTLNFPLDTIARDDYYNYRGMIKHDANGFLHIVNTRETDIVSSTREVFYRTNISGHFDTTQLTNNNVDDNYATLGFDQNGSVHIGWEERDGSNNYQLMYTNNTSGSFAKPIWITSGGLNKGTPSIAVGKDSTIHFVYFTFTNVQDSAYYRTYNYVTNVLGPEINLGPAEASSENDIEAVVDSSNHVHIIFCKNFPLNASALKYFTNDSGTLAEINTTLTANIEYPDVMIDRYNMVHIIYRLSTDKRIYVYRRYAGGEFFQIEPVTPPSIGNPAYWRGFDVDDDRRLYVTYQNSSSSAPKGIFLVYGTVGNYSAPILVFEDSTGQYVTRGSSSVAALGNKKIAVLFDVAGARGGIVFSDMFVKQGTLTATGISNDQRQPSRTFALLNNYPNPFNPTTSIGFSLLAGGNVSLKVYNIMGEEVATLVHNELMETGEHKVEWNAGTFPSGVYYYQLNVNNGAFVETKKLVLMK